MTDSFSIRIHKFIANNTAISRREAEKLITNGYVNVNDKKAIIGQKINPNKDIVMIKNKKVVIAKQEITIAVNKEKGIIVSKNEPQKNSRNY